MVQYNVNLEGKTVLVTGAAGSLVQIWLSAFSKTLKISRSLV